MGLRRSNIVRWDAYLDKILEEFESSEDVLPSDKALCQWIRLLRITEDAKQRLERDEISVAGLSDSKIQKWLKDFENGIDSWDKQKHNQATLRKSCTQGCNSSIVLDLL